MVHDFVVFLFCSIGLFKVRKRTKAFVFPMYMIMACLWFVTFLLSLIFKEDNNLKFYFMCFEAVLYWLMIVPLCFGIIAMYKPTFSKLRKAFDDIPQLFRKK